MQILPSQPGRNTQKYNIDKIKFRYGRTETYLVRAQISNNLNVIPSFQNSKTLSKEPIRLIIRVSLLTLLSVQLKMKSQAFQPTAFLLALEPREGWDKTVETLPCHHNGDNCTRSEMTTQKKVSNGPFRV